jgi:hypothetical protein
MPETLDEAPVAQSAPAPAVDPQIEALKQHNQRLIGEKRQVQSRLEEMEQKLQALTAEQTTRQQQQLEESGQFRTLWEQANETNKQLEKEIEALRKQLADRDSETQRLLLRTQFLNKAANDVLAPDQLYRLVENDLQLNEGQLVARKGGIEVDFDRYLETLKAPGSGYEHFFRASGAVGMGTKAQLPVDTTTSNNPYLTGNLTAIVALEAENPELANQLKTEAARARQ